MSFRNRGFRKKSRPAWFKKYHHVSITVPDMDEACDFFSRVFGCRELFRMGEFKSDSDHLEVHLNIHPRSVIKEHRMMAFPDGFNLSLFQYESPGQNMRMPRNSDIGGHHLAVEVSDLEGAIHNLESHGYKIMGRPIEFEDGPNLGVTSAYFLSPWGLQLEFVYYFNKASKASARRSSG